jgi:hypothetical protein
MNEPTLGQKLALLRKQESKNCPICGQEFTAIKTARACKKCAQHASYLRWKNKKETNRCLPPLPEKTMKKVTRIEMADDNNIYDLSFGKELTIKPEGEGFSTFEGNEENNYYHTKEQAEQANAESIIDDDLIITGYGKHSGRKFWQLPESMKAKIRKMANN